MPVVFQNIQDEKVENVCREVKKRYKILDDAIVVIEQRRLRGVTMRALPKVKSFFSFFGQRKYTIQVAMYVRDSNNKRVMSLDEEILTGWIAHEFGHIVDYHGRNFWQMIVYGLKYWLSKSFAREVEHEADRIAVRHGFLSEIIATKKFLFHSPDISTGYRSRLEKLYMSIEEVKICVPEDQRIV